MTTPTPADSPDSPGTHPESGPDSTAKPMDKIMALCKRRGFVYQASEIYGGIQGFWDYGPLGSQLKKNLRDAWWTDVVMKGCNGQTGPDGKPVRIVPIDTCIIQNPKVWEASGHVGGFNDPMVDDKETKQRFRADHLYGMVITDAPADARMDLNNLRQQVDEQGYVVVNHTVTAGGEGEIVDWLQTSPKELRKVHGGVTGVEITSQGLVAKFAEDHVGLVFPIPEADTKVHFATIPSPFTGKRGVLTEPRQFNLMFYSFAGATSGEDNKVYLRPETAQGIFINFKNVVDTTRVSLPFGIAQTGKAFRNEVTPRNFTFRSREFEQMEIEFFCHADDAGDWYQFWRDWRMQWWQGLGLSGENLIMREHDKDELAHYAKDGAGTADVEYRFPFTFPGYGELEGVAHRSNFDLSAHQNHPDSNTKLEYFDATRGELAKNGQPKGERYLPHVIEPSAGLDRGVLAVLCEAYTVDESRPSPEFMKIHPRLAPIKAAVFPLIRKHGMPEVATSLYQELVQRFGAIGFIEYDEKQSIGKRYARMDEAGCPWCFTIDGETIEDGENKDTVTARDRDTGEQHRLKLSEVGDFLAGKLGV